MSSEHHGNQLSHVASKKSLLGTFAALIALTILTVAVRVVDFGSANLIIGMAIACTKATLVILFFMHLAHDRPFNGMAVGLGVLAVILFIAICLIDTGQYHDSIIGFDGDYQTPDFSHGGGGHGGEGGHGAAVPDHVEAPMGHVPGPDGPTDELPGGVNKDAALAPPAPTGAEAGAAPEGNPPPPGDRDIAAPGAGETDADSAAEPAADSAEPETAGDSDEPAAAAE